MNIRAVAVLIPLLAAQSALAGKSSRPTPREQRIAKGRQQTLAKHYARVNPGAKPVSLVGERISWFRLRRPTEVHLKDVVSFGPRSKWSYPGTFRVLVNRNGRVKKLTLRNVRPVARGRKEAFRGTLDNRVYTEEYTEAAQAGRDSTFRLAAFRTLAGGKLPSRVTLDDGRYFGNSFTAGTEEIVDLFVIKEPGSPARFHMALRDGRVIGQGAELRWTDPKNGAKIILTPTHTDLFLTAPSR